MSETIQLKLTRNERAAAKRLAGLHGWQVGTARANPYDRCRETTCRDDEEAVLWAVLQALKGAAK